MVTVLTIVMRSFFVGPSEKYIVLMLENLPLVQHQNALENILSGIGRENQLNKFPRKISLDEAKNKLMAQDKGSSVACLYGTSALCSGCLITH